MTEAGLVSYLIFLQKSVVQLSPSAHRGSSRAPSSLRQSEQAKLPRLAAARLRDRLPPFRRDRDHDDSGRLVAERPWQARSCRGEPGAAKATSTGYGRTSRTGRSCGKYRKHPDEMAGEARLELAIAVLETVALATKLHSRGIGEVVRLRTSSAADHAGYPGLCRR
jgi:hypothetical protein